MGCGEVKLKHVEAPQKDAHYISQDQSKTALDEALQRMFGNSALPPHTDVALHMACTALPKADRLSKTDAFVVVSIQNHTTHKWELLGKTETIINCMEPTFVTPISLKFFFEEKQLVKFDIYDQDNENTDDLSKQELLGSVETSMSVIFTSKSNQFDLKGKHKTGKIKVVCEVLASSRTTITLDMTLHEIGVFLLISKKGFPWIPIFKSQVTKTKMSNILLEINSSDLCNGNYDEPIKFEIFTVNKKKESALKEEQIVTLNSLKTISELNFKGIYFRRCANAT
jgi:C2 domain